MLSPAEVIPFLTAPARDVRNQARRYFVGTSDFGPLTADHYWDAIDHVGPDQDDDVSFLSRLAGLPQTPRSFQRLMQAIRSAPDELRDFHLQHAIGELDLSLLAASADEVLGCEQILPHVREHLRQRLELRDQLLEPLWDRLMEHGREVAECYAGEFDGRIAQRLIEALARRPEAFAQRAIDVLADPGAEEDWRQIFAVDFLAEARWEPAVDSLLGKLLIDADMLREQTVRALSRIGTGEIVEKLQRLYPEQPWHVRLYAMGPLGNIKRPESEAALLRLLEGERDEDLQCFLIDQLCDLASLGGLARARQIIARAPDHPESLGLAEGLLAVAAMTGQTLPEEQRWRKRLAQRDARVARRLRDFDFDLFKEMRQNWRASGQSATPRGDADDLLDEGLLDEEPAFVTAPRYSSPPPLESNEPYRRSAPKVGRNDPCPCGSGKKYKKCCGQA